MKVGVFVDVSNLYHKINKKFVGEKLDYEAYLQRIDDKIGTVVRSYAYGSQQNKEAVGFITCLKVLGFVPRYKRPRIIRIRDIEIKTCDWGCGLTLDVVNLIDKVDVIVLGSANPDLLPLVEWIKDQGKQVVIFASGIPKHLQRAADEAIEIDETLMEDRDSEEGVNPYGE